MKNETEFYIGQDVHLALRQLDSLLEAVVADAKINFAADFDKFRGLYVTEKQVTESLAKPPATSTLSYNKGKYLPLVDISLKRSNLAWLARAYGLNSEELDILVVAAAIELDLRYERIYAFLQDDVTKKRPTVDLVFNLFSTTAQEKLKLRAALQPDAPLIRNRIIILIPNPNEVQSSFLAHNLKVDEQVMRLLLGNDDLDARLQHSCQLVRFSVTSKIAKLETNLEQSLYRRIQQARKTGEPLRIYLKGDDASENKDLIRRVAAKLAKPLLVMELGKAVESGTAFEELIDLIFREAWFRDAMLLICGLDDLREPKSTSVLNVLFEKCTADGGTTFFSGSLPWDARCEIIMTTVACGALDVGARKKLWRNKLKSESTDLTKDDFETLSRFSLTRAEITRAITSAKEAARWHVLSSSNGKPNTQNPDITPEQLFTAVRSQSSQALEKLATKVNPKYTWDDIVLEKDPLKQLRDLCLRFTHKHKVFEEWGFDEKLSYGKGTNALFSGPAGTGKTMAAEVIANELHLDLYKIDLASVVSKYIGETEKNLKKVFKAAQCSNAILFFDEADALFGKRSEVRDAHDRYANIEISYLLQEMESYQGISILASNLRGNLDDAFFRRLSFIVQFPFPDESSRFQIWKTIWPKETPVNGVSFERLAREFNLSGGNIKNAALSAAYSAAADDAQVADQHILLAVQSEFKKMGKNISLTEHILTTKQ